MVKHIITYYIKNPPLLAKSSIYLLVIKMDISFQYWDELLKLKIKN